MKQGLTRRTVGAGVMWPEKIPALPGSLRELPEVDRWERELGQWWHDFRAQLDRLQPGSASLSVNIAGSTATGGLGGAGGGSRDGAWYLEVENAARKIFLLEARLGDAEAYIKQVDEVAVTANSALAQRTVELSARVGSSQSKITQILRTFATREYAEALKSEAISSAVDGAEASFTSTLSTYATQSYAETKKTEAISAAAGDATSKVETEAGVRATKDGYMHGHYLLRVTAGNKIAGMKLSADADPTGWSTKSAIEFQADVFKISTGAAEGAAVAPFILDGTTLTLNANLVVNGAPLSTFVENAALPGLNYIGAFATAPAAASHPVNSVYRNTTNNNSYIRTDAVTWVLFLEAGPTGTDGGFTDYVFKRSTTAPSTPTGDTPAGWSDSPPTGTDPLWMSVADKTAGGTLVGAWSTPIRVDGVAGDSLTIEYSVDGSTSWHGTFTNGDIFMRQKVGGGSWSAAIRIVGEQGEAGGYTEYVFKRAASAPETPTGDTPAGWSDAPPTGTDPLWLSLAEKLADGTLVGVWSTPAQIEGADGESLGVEYSIDGATLWHGTFTAGDFFMRQRIGTGTWSAAIRIVGEQGEPGGYTDYIFKRSGTAPATPTGDTPAGWSDAPPTGTDQLWMSTGYKTDAGVLVGAWSTPVNMGGNDGDPVVMEYSVDGATSWHGTFAPGDLYARHKIGAAGSWTAAYRIVGEQGTSGNYTSYVFKRSAVAPATPTGDAPAGWSDAPPAGTDPLYLARATKTAAGVLVGVWSTPVKIDGDPGADGDSVSVEYSVNGSTLWHATFTTGDLYMRQKIGAGAWSGAIRIVGEDGGYVDYLFKRSATAPATPTGNTPAGWSDAPPAGTDPLYMSSAFRNAADVVQGVWSSPVRLDADAGASISVEYSIDGATSWHATFTTGDFFMRQRVGTGNWSSAIRILGEQGAAGGYTDYLFQRAAAAPATPTGNTPAGWLDAPPAGTDPLWMSVGDKTAAGVLIGVWSTPSRLDADDGASVSVEYSVNGISSWHSTFSTGDLFMRQKVGSGAWSAAIRIVGEQGGYTDYLFQRAAATPATPTGNAPAGWLDAPPAGTDPLWMVMGDRSNAGTLIGTWSAPVRMDADDGDSVAVEYSVDGSTNWHGTFVAGTDYFMRVKVGSGAWSSGARIVGEVGAAGGYTDYLFQRATEQPATPTGNTPSGWSDAPPTGTDQLWMVKATKTAAGVLVGVWSTPVNLGGQDGDPVLMEYSVNGATLWHATFTAGDQFARHKIGAAGTFTAAYRIVGEQGSSGNFVDYLFRRAASVPATPTGSDPAGWSDSPPAATVGADPLWMTTGTKTAAGVLVGVWSTPVRFDGDSVAVEYSVDGATGWTATFNPATHFFMRQKVGGVWSAAARIVGEAGAYTDYIFRRGASAPATPTGDSPAGWAGEPPAGTDPLWMSKGRKIASGVLQGTWSAPVRLDGVAGNFQDYIFVRSASQPDTPTGDTPAGWGDTPPSGSDQLWMSTATKTSAGVLIGVWSLPANLGGADGESLIIEYSVDGLTSWHSTFAGTDFFARQKVGVNGTYTAAYRIQGENGASVSVEFSADGSTGWSGTFNPATHLYMRLKVGAGAWGAAARIVGEKGESGNFIDHVFKRSATAPSAPTGNDPAGWSDSPPAGTDPLYLSTATKTAAGVLVGAWSAPVRIDADAGASVSVQYSIDGSTLWHDTFTAGDLFMRQKVGSGAWSSAIRIVGEQGGYTDYVFKRAASEPSTPTGNTPAGWIDGPPTGTDPLWMSKAKKTSAGVVVGVWSAPVRLDGAPGQYIDRVFKRGTDQPGTPTGDTPVGWSDVPPSGSETLWMSEARKTGAGVLIQPGWSTPVNIGGADGDGVIMEYSADGSTIWHSEFNAITDYYARQKIGLNGTFTAAYRIRGENGNSVQVQYSHDGVVWHNPPFEGGLDIYMRTRVGSEAAWSMSMRIVGEQGLSGNYIDHIFIRSTTNPGTPTGNSPVGWYGAPPAGTKPLWFSKATKTASGVLVGVWSAPTRLDGDGMQVEFSINGSSWHSAPFVAGDLYMRLKKGEEAWSSAMRIVGEKGDTGTPGTTGTNGLTSYLHIKYSDDGGTTFTASNGEVAGKWMGQYTDFSPYDSNTPSAYTWKKIAGEDGQPGTNGTNGTNGERGSKAFVAAAASAAWNDTTANTAITAAGLVKVLLDQVTLTYSTWAEMRFWSGTAWIKPVATINGDMLVQGTIGTQQLAAGISITTPTIIGGTFRLNGSCTVCSTTADGFDDSILRMNGGGGDGRTRGGQVDVIGNEYTTVAGYAGSVLITPGASADGTVRLRDRFGFDRVIVGTDGGINLTSAVVCSSSVQASSFAKVSSRRWKDNIRPFSYALDLLRRVRPVRFDWNTKDLDNDFGFIAEEMRMVLPSAVQMDGLGNCVGIDYGQLVTVVWAAMLEMLEERN